MPSLPLDTRLATSPRVPGPDPIAGILAGALGGVLLAGLALALGLGWIVALLAYSFGGSAVLFSFAVACIDRPCPARQRVVAPAELGLARAFHG